MRHDQERIRQHLAGRYPSEATLRSFLEVYGGKKEQVNLNTTGSLTVAPYRQGVAIFSYNEPIIYAEANRVQLGDFLHSHTTIRHFNYFSQSFCRADGFPILPGDVYVDGKPVTDALSPAALAALRRDASAFYAAYYEPGDARPRLVHREGKYYFNAGRARQDGVRTKLRRLVQEVLRQYGEAEPRRRWSLLLQDVEPLDKLKVVQLLEG